MRKPYDRKSNNMEKRQFLVLYRSFLMRVIDLELLPPMRTRPDCLGSLRRCLQD
jgi:hypothetical protein